MMEVSASPLLYESVLDCIVFWKAVPLTKPFTKEYAVRAMYAMLLRFDGVCLLHNADLQCSAGRPAT